MGCLRSQCSRVRFAPCLLVFVAGLLATGSPVAAQPALFVFPNSSFTVEDGGTGDQDFVLNGEIALDHHPVPDVDDNATPFRLSGLITTNYTGPTTGSAGTATVTITDAWIENTAPSIRLAIGSTPFDRIEYAGMLEFVFFDHGLLSGNGDLTLSIDGQFGESPSLVGPGDPLTPDQQIHLGLSDTVFSNDGFALAKWLRPPGPFSTVLNVSANASLSGTFLAAAGTLQIHIDDALVLGRNFDTLVFPSSIVATAGSPPPVPTVSSIGIVAAALLLAAAGVLVRLRST